jgi:hypothetical protein
MNPNSPSDVTRTQNSAKLGRGMKASHYGTCLCGATEWLACGVPSSVHYCHCSMCRRWTGSPFATLIWFARVDVKWTGRPPVSFRSSPLATRSHCGLCGTPMYLEYPGQTDIALTVGTMNNPEMVTPTHHYGCESRLPWVDIGQALPARPTEESW